MRKRQMKGLSIICSASEIVTFMKFSNDLAVFFECESAADARSNVLQKFVTGIDLRLAR